MITDFLDPKESAVCQFEAFRPDGASFILAAADVLRRLFSTFARGWPGVGLLFMRLTAGATLILRQDAPPLHHIIAGVVGIFLFAGLWTPVVGTLVALDEFRQALAGNDLWIHVLLGTLGAAAALVGPGAWSLDRRLFGWRRIDPPPRKR